MWLACIHECPANVLADDIHLIGVAEQQVDLRTFSATISKANASLTLAIERLYFYQRNPTSLCTLSKHGDVESEPGNYDGVVNTIKPRAHNFCNRRLECGFRINSTWLGNDGSIHTLEFSNQ